MKRGGAGSGKRAGSPGVGAGREQQKTTARGSGLDKDAPNAPPLQLAAVALGRRRIGDRPGLNAIVDAAVAKIGARGGESQRSEEIALLTLQALPFPLRGLGRAHRAELKAVALAAGGCWRWRRGGARRLALGRRRRRVRRGGGTRRRRRRGRRWCGAGGFRLLLWRPRGGPGGRRRRLRRGQPHRA